MSVDKDGDRDGDRDGENQDEDVCLALSFEGVVDRLRKPNEVFDSISDWTDHVGIVSSKPKHVVNGFCTSRDIHIDFFSDEGGKLQTLQKTKERGRFDSDRYVFVGASRRDEAVAEKAGWEYTDVEEAAERGSWDLSGSEK
ncbi:hypothetical protein ACEU6E_08355 [Halorutilales archaeon Cl-col2-1]